MDILMDKVDKRGYVCILLYYYVVIIFKNSLEDIGMAHQKVCKQALWFYDYPFFLFFF